jgi:L-amino acid N-acyltransferase YncA
MSYSLHRYGSGQGKRLARFVLPIACRTYAQWVDAAPARAWARFEHGVQAWNARLDDPFTHVLVCERTNGSIAACAFVQITGETAYFGGLYVEDTGRGLATSLREERLRIARESGARTALMVIRRTNEPARILAEKAGFSVVGEKPCALLPTVPRLVYAMALDAPARMSA